MLDLVKIKEDFSSLVLDTQPWTLAQFVMWLDLKLSEYKIRGYMVLDHDKKTKPRWLVDPLDEVENTSDTVPAPPPCRKPCCWTDRSDPRSHYDNRGHKSHDFLAEYHDSVPDANKCIIDLSEQALSAQRSQRDDPHTNIDHDRLRESQSKDNISEMSFQNSSHDVIEIPEHDHSDTSNQGNKYPQASHSLTRKPQAAHTSGTDYGSVRKAIPSVQKKPIAIGSTADVSHTSSTKSASTSSPHFSSPSDLHMVQAFMETQQSHYTQSHSMAAKQGPVPIALHAAGSEVQGQMVYQQDSSTGQGQVLFQQDVSQGLTSIASANEKCSEMVQDVKKEVDTVGDLQILSEVSNTEQSALFGDTSRSSDDETWAGRFTASDASWSPGQGRPMMRRPISEAAKKVELPRFEDPIVRRVLEDTAPPSRHIWSKIITRCAYHMLSKGVPHKHDYQIFSEAFYHRYPCIGTNRGPNPWSDFSKSVSKKCRNIRFLSKRKASVARHTPASTHAPSNSERPTSASTHVPSNLDDTHDTSMTMQDCVLQEHFSKDPLDPLEKQER